MALDTQTHCRWRVQSEDGWAGGGRHHGFEATTVRELLLLTKVFAKWTKVWWESVLTFYFPNCKRNVQAVVSISACTSSNRLMMMIMMTNLVSLDCWLTRVNQRGEPPTN